MPNSKFYFGFFASLIFILCFASFALAKKDAVSIAILPFEVNASQDLRYLEESLPELLADRFKDAGLEVVAVSAAKQAMVRQNINSLDIENVRQIALDASADFAFYGVFSQVEDAFYLESRLVDAYGMEPVQAISSTENGLINLLPLVDNTVAKVRSLLTRETIISTLDVQGTGVLDKEVVLMHLGLQKGDLFSPKAVNEEIKNIYELGYFDDVFATVSDEPEGKRVILTVKEKPRIQSLGVSGNKELDDDDILEIVSSKTGAVLNPNVLRTDLAMIRSYYKNEGYYNTKVTYEVEGGENGQARLNFKIEEGKKLYIEEIIFDGAEQLDVDELKDQLALSEKWMFTWLDDSGVLNEEFLDRDGATVQAYYNKKGFLAAKVARPEVDFQEDGIYVTFRVQEGPRFKISDITFEGELLTDETEYKEIIALDELQEDDEYINSEIVRSDIAALTKFYGDHGYAYANVEAKYLPNMEQATVAVLFVAEKQQKVHIRRVVLSGNTATRDNVILRMLQVGDGDLFRTTAVEKSVKGLENLDYFAGVNIEPIPTGDPTEVDLKVAVQEKSTGTVGGGVGYSSSDGAFISANITERNLWGMGNELSLGMQLGETATSWNLNFFNPRIYDSPWGVGFTSSLTDKEYTDYDKESIGLGVNASRKLGEFTSFRVAYFADIYDLSDIDVDASDLVKEAEGSHFASTVGITFARSTLERDGFYYSAGALNSIGMTYAGVGGTDHYVKWLYSSDYYTPLIGSLVFHARGKIGLVHKNFSGDDIPAASRFYSGGLDSVRGYSSNKIAPRDDDGDRIGGNKFASTSLELTYPLDRDYGVLGLLFFDAGNAWREGEAFFSAPDMTGSSEKKPSYNLYKSIGAGIRWMSPMGPIRLEYGYGLDKLEDSSSHRFEFMMGQQF